ncbi:MAG: hypothetical protein R3F35_11730 [Myxococcota bacterium]
MELDVVHLNALLKRWRERGGPYLDEDYRQLSLASIETSLQDEPPSVLLAGAPSKIRTERRRFGAADLKPLYLYENYRFWTGDESLFARSYSHAPETVCFLCRLADREVALLELEDFRSGLFREAISYLRELGKSTFEYERPSGREPIPADLVP